MASKVLKLPGLRRAMTAGTVTVRKEDDGRTRVQLSVSSEAPVERFGFVEILSHKPGHVRMDRLNARAVPFLFNHNSDRVLGMVESARLEGGRIEAEVALFDTADSRDAAAQMDGGLHNVSVGYRIHEVVENKKANTMTATDWEPYEFSLAPVPADFSVGVGRGEEGEARAVRVIVGNQSADAAGEGKRVSKAAKAADTQAVRADDVDQDDLGHDGAEGDVVEAGSGANATAVEREKARQRGIRNLGTANKIPEEQVQFWINSGVDLTAVADDILGIVQERAATTKAVTELDLSPQDTRQFSLARAIEAAASGNWRKAPFEMECSRELYKRLGRTPDERKFLVPFDIQRRDPVASATAVRALMQALGRRDLNVAGAGSLVGTEHMGFIELLRNRSVAFRMGATRLPGLTQNVAIPRQITSATAGWMADEATPVAESQATFNQLTLAPKTAAAWTEISRQLILQSQPAAEQIVSNDLAATVALAVDTGVLSGSGASGQPTGITNVGGIGSVTGTSLAYAGMLEFQEDLATANVIPARGGYVTTPTVAKLLSTRVKFSNTATPLWDGNLWDAVACGFPAMSSNQVAAASMIFADWSQVVVGEWSVLEVETNPYQNFQAGIIGVRAMYTMDVGLRYAGAVSVASTIT